VTILGRFQLRGQISRTRRKRLKQLEILNASDLETPYPKMLKRVRKTLFASLSRHEI
jgi:hypothetical protein